MQHRRLVLLTVISTLALVSGPALAQFALDGDWNLSASATLPIEGGGPCEYAGQTSLTEADGAISGFAELLLQSGVGGCPEEMSAELLAQGGFDGDTFFLSGALMGGPLGEADFSGELTPNPGGSGTFDVTSGPFAGSTGSWTAERLLASIEIPTLTPLALTVLLLLIVVAGYALLRRRPVA